MLSSTQGLSHQGRMPMSRQSVAKAHQKNPLKQVLRSYFPMQEEKDHRVYGAQDGAIRGNMFRQVQERWLEWQKLFLSIIPLPEVSGSLGMPVRLGARAH